MKHILRFSKINSWTTGLIMSSLRIDKPPYNLQGYRTNVITVCRLPHAFSFSFHINKFQFFDCATWCIKELFVTCLFYFSFIFLCNSLIHSFHCRIQDFRRRLYSKPLVVKVILTEDENYVDSSTYMNS